MSTLIARQGDTWIIKGDTRSIKDLLLNAGAVWQAQRVRWEYTGEKLPEAIKAVIEGRNVLCLADPPKPELPPWDFELHAWVSILSGHDKGAVGQVTQRGANSRGFAYQVLTNWYSASDLTSVQQLVSETNWDKLTGILCDLRDVLRGHQTLAETTAWVHSVNAEARRLDQQWEANIARKRAQAVAHGLPVEAGGMLLNMQPGMRSDNDAFVQLASGGTAQSLQELVTNATMPPASIRFYSVVVPKSITTRKKLLKSLIDADAIGIVQYNTSATRWSVLWSTGVVEIMDEDEIELASVERVAQMLPAVEGATVLYASKRTAARGSLLKLKSSGKWEVELSGGSKVSEFAKGLIVLAHPKATVSESWWIDEDDTVFRDDDPKPDHFAVLRGPFTSRAAAEKVLAVGAAS